MTIYNFYVYAYLREDGSPYYIGKGRQKRAYNKNHSISLPRDKSRIVFLETNLSNIGALALERRYIRWYGRKDNDTGILRNLTDGGEGSSGILGYWKNKKLSEKHREKLSVASRNRNHIPWNKGKKHTIETRIKIANASRNRKMTEETKAKLSKINKNRIVPRETKEKLSKTMTMRGIKPSINNRRSIINSISKLWTFHYPNDNSCITVKNLKQFCRDNDLEYSKMKRKSKKFQKKQIV